MFKRSFSLPIHVLLVSSLAGNILHKINFKRASINAEKCTSLLNRQNALKWRKLLDRYFSSCSNAANVVKIINFPDLIIFQEDNCSKRFRSFRWKYKKIELTVPTFANMIIFSLKQKRVVALISQII